MASSLDFLLEVGYRFNQSPEEVVVTFYLPRLIADVTDACIHRANVYAAEPRDLARGFAPVASCPNGDRWFFTTCRRIKGKVSRAAGGGTWVSQTNKDIKNRDGFKIGETKNFRFKKNDGKKYTDWLMEEYHPVGGQQAGDLEPVVCRVYVSPRAPPNSAARRETAAPLPRQEPAALPELAAPLVPAPATITQQQQKTAPLKRPASSAPVAETVPCAKKMRGPDASAMPVTSRRVMTPPPPTHPPPIPTYLMDPFEPPPQPPTAPLMDAAPAPSETGPERDDEVDDYAELAEQLFRHDGDEIAGPVAPPVVQTIATNDDEPHEFSDEDMDELRKLMDDKIEEAVDAGDDPQG